MRRRQRRISVILLANRCPGQERGPALTRCAPHCHAGDAPDSKNHRRIDRLLRSISIGPDVVLIVRGRSHLSRCATTRSVRSYRCRPRNSLSSSSSARWRSASCQADLDSLFPLLGRQAQCRSSSSMTSASPGHTTTRPPRHRPPRLFLSGHRPELAWQPTRCS